MANIFEKHISDLKYFDNQRKAWLVLSAFVILAVLGIIFEWHKIESSVWLWTLGTSGIVVSVVWWYWTMRLIRGLLEFKIEEANLLSDIITDLKEIKQNLSKHS